MLRHRRSLDRFARLLLAIVLVALAVRVTYVAWGKGGRCPTATPGVVIPSECAGAEGRASDQVWYNATANLVARGDGFTVAFGPNAGRPAADHPPLTVFVLAPVSWIGDRLPAGWFDDPSNTVLHRYTMALLGTLLVALIGVAGRRIGGDAVGLGAAGLAAISPGLWVNDGLIMSETPSTITVVLVLLAALHFARRRTLGRALLVGVAVGAATLGRAELILLAPLVAAAVLGRDLLALRNRTTLATIGAAGLGLVVVLAPWVVYNNTRFEKLTFVSTNEGLAIAASNCDPVYTGAGIGLTSYDAAPADASAEVKAQGRWCVEDPEPGFPDADQSEVSASYRSRALRYANNHLKRVPVVMAARVGRVWNLFRPADNLSYNQGEGRERWASTLIMVGFYPTALMAMVGAALLARRARRRGRTVIGLLVAPCVVVTVSVALTYGQARFRAPAEPSLILLAALGAVMLLAPRALGGFCDPGPLSGPEPEPAASGAVS